MPFLARRQNAIQSKWQERLGQNVSRQNAKYMYFGIYVYLLALCIAII